MRVAILYCGQNLIGSRCSSFRSSVTWLYLDFLRISFAALFVGPLLKKVLNFVVPIVILQGWNYTSDCMLFVADETSWTDCIKKKKIFSLQREARDVWCLSHLDSSFLPPPLFLYQVLMLFLSCHFCASSNTNSPFSWLFKKKIIRKLQHFSLRVRIFLYGSCWAARRW